PSALLVGRLRGWVGRAEPRGGGPELELERLAGDVADVARALHLRAGRRSLRHVALDLAIAAVAALRPDDHAGAVSGPLGALLVSVTARGEEPDADSDHGAGAREKRHVRE